MKSPRIRIDVAPEMKRRLRSAAARRGLTVHQYVLEVLEERLRADLSVGFNGLSALTAQADSVLARLWDNSNDAEYDRL